MMDLKLTQNKNTFKEVAKNLIPFLKDLDVLGIIFDNSGT
jgi:hypothetical protein